MIVMGVDPGIAITGWGIVEKTNEGKYRLIGNGVVKTDKDTIFAERLREIFIGLKKTIDEYRPDIVAVEQLFAAKNIKNAMLVSHARGVVLLCAAMSGIRVTEFSALQVKLALVGYGRAEKQQVQKMVKNFLRLESIPKPDDMADALAVAICHLNSEKTARMNS